LTSAQERSSTTNTLTYANDRSGNRTDGGTTYDAANQVSGWTYDAAGNLTNDGTTSYAYDALHRQVGTTTGGQTTTYDLTGAGLLRTRNDGPSSTDYGYDLAQPLPPVIFSNQLNGPQNRFMYAGADLLARLPLRPIDPAHWVEVDGLGSVRQDLDRSGALNNRLRQGPCSAARDRLTYSGGIGAITAQSNECYTNLRSIEPFVKGRGSRLPMWRSAVSACRC
jgi:hypothetical protein